jgi:RNA polymerase sigma factor (sigma-70 family)
MALVETDGVAASDDALIAAAKAGDPAAFEYLYRRYRSEVRTYCFRSLSDPHIAEDITQETFLKAFGHIGEFEPGRRLWPWLMTIAKRLCIDELRGINRRDALGRRAPHGADPHDATSQEAMARVETQRLNRVIAGAVAALRPRDRKVVLQSIEGWTHQEIAQHHGMSVHAVRNLAWRARRSLRRSLASERDQAWSVLLGFRGAVWTRRGTSGSWRRGQPRPWMDVRVAHPILEQAAAVVLGLAAAGAAMFAGGTFGGGEPRTTDFGSVRAMSGHQTVAVASNHSASSGRDDGSARHAPSPMMVGASVSFAGRHDGAAAPYGARGRIEVRDQNGRTIAWYEHDLHCGARGDRLLPHTGPINVIC